jgi:hypothetical protein
MESTGVYWMPVFHALAEPGGGVAAVAGVDVDEVETAAHDRAQRRSGPPAVDDGRVRCGLFPAWGRPVAGLGGGVGVGEEQGYAGCGQGAGGVEVGALLRGQR